MCGAHFAHPINQTYKTTPLQMYSEYDTRTDIVFRTDANIPQEVESNVWHLHNRKIKGNQAEEIERKRRNPHSKKKKTDLSGNKTVTICYGGLSPVPCQRC